MNAESVTVVEGRDGGPKDHTLVSKAVRKEVSARVLYDKRPARDFSGKGVDGLFNAWITLDNPTQFNSYTTDMVKGVILAFREASVARDVVAVVFTGSGDKAFCTGGNTKEYAEYYAGNPQEYRGYMRLFNDMVSAILSCDKPVICRVNGMRIGGGQEIGMACDFSVAQDLARFGQACVLCEPFSAHQACFMGMVTDVVPALQVDGKFIANPLVETERMTDECGRIVYGQQKTGDALKAGRELLKRGTVNLALLDETVESLCTKLLYTFPDCTTKTVEELRKPKLDAWNRNKENSRAWLALNMMTEARAGFRAFNEGTRETGREIDFIALRRALAANTPWSDDLTGSILPRAGKTP